jgi:hypothetical protein
MSLVYFSGSGGAPMESAIKNFVALESVADGLRVTTHCMYPSNGLVRVTLKGGHQTVMATDDGEAVGEALAAGIAPGNADNVLRHLFRDQGIAISRGIIYSPAVPIEDVNLVIVQVANAARDAALWLYSNIRLKKTRDFENLLSAYLEREFANRLSHKYKIAGKSSKSHKFNNVIALSNNEILIVDPVLNDASSINSRVVANLDVRALENPKIHQRIVYDDEDRWSASNLNLLQVGATVVPFSRARDVIGRIASHPGALE